MLIEIGQRVVAAFEQFDTRTGVTRRHLAPVEQLVALGDDRQVTLWLRDRRRGHRAQLVDELGAEDEALGGVVEAGVLADPGGEWLAQPMGRREWQETGPVS